MLKHWKFWLVIAFSLSIIIVFQNCAPNISGQVDTTKPSTLSSTPINDSGLLENQQPSEN